MNAEALLIARLLLHVATVVMLAMYHAPNSTFKGKASLCSGLVMGSSAAMAVQILSTWDNLVQSEPQPQLVIFVFAVFLPIALARGNMATVISWLNTLVPRSWRPW